MEKILLDDLSYIFNSSSNNFIDIKNKSFFITGGTGFVGKWLIQTLLYANQYLDYNIKALILTRNIENILLEFPYLKHDKYISFITGDIRSFSFPKFHCDYIIHAATDTDNSEIINNPLNLADVVVNGTVHLLDYAIQCKNCRVLYLSSGAIYGTQPKNLERISEEYNGGPNPIDIGSSYAESKRMAEFVCASYIRKHNIHVSIARCFAFVGPYLSLNKHFAIGNFINDLLLERDIVIIGNGEPQRSYLYAADMVIHLLSILVLGRSMEVYNVGSDKPISIKSLAELVSSFSNKVNVKILNKNSTFRSFNYIPDNSKLKKEFKIIEELPLNIALEKTINFYLLKKNT